MSRASGSVRVLLGTADVSEQVVEDAPPKESNRNTLINVLKGNIGPVRY
jgi:hypothetical protein